MEKTNLSAHINELKLRVIISLVAYVVGVSICFCYASEINDFLLEPLVKIIGKKNLSRRLIFTGLTEGFFNQMKIAMYTGFAASFPILAWQLYFFIAPGLYRSEREILLPSLIAAPCLFLLGALLVYYYLMPVAWEFFLSFEHPGKVPIILEARISEYLNLALEMIVSFGIAFQLPLVLIFLVKSNIVEVNSLKRLRKHVIVLIFIIAAVLTPPDVISQIALALPLLLLYEISLLICQRIEKNRK